MKGSIRDGFLDLFVFGGIMMAGYASWRAHGEAGLVVPGVMLFILGILLLKPWAS